MNYQQLIEDFKSNIQRLKSEKKRIMRHEVLANSGIEIALRDNPLGFARVLQTYITSTDNYNANKDILAILSETSIVDAIIDNTDFLPLLTAFAQTSPDFGTYLLHKDVLSLAKTRPELSNVIAKLVSSLASSDLNIRIIFSANKWILDLAATKTDDGIKIIEALSYTIDEQLKLLLSEKHFLDILIIHLNDESAHKAMLNISALHELPSEKIRRSSDLFGYMKTALIKTDVLMLAILNMHSFQERQYIRLESKTIAHGITESMKSHASKNIANLVTYLYTMSNVCLNGENQQLVRNTRPFVHFLCSLMKDNKEDIYVRVLALLTFSRLFNEDIKLLFSRDEIFFGTLIALINEQPVMNHGRDTVITNYLRREIKIIAGSIAHRILPDNNQFQLLHEHYLRKYHV